MEIIERYSTPNDLMTLVILLVLLLLVIAKQLYPYRFEDFTALFSSGKYMVIKSREHKALFGFNVLMLIIHLLIASIFIFVLYRAFIDPEVQKTGILFLRIFTAYGFLVLLKVTVEKIIGNIFDLDEAIENYLFQKHSYRNFISLGLFIISIFLVYSSNLSKLAFYLTGAFIAATWVFSYVRILSKNQGFITLNLFYFILYLCALEIAPYIILYKLIIRS
ncbi:DUF4271 domain-containing protein [Gillisia sp. Q332]|uniref:DUF4271 domain-containing protein n=1 Tax=Gillisia xinjiangensis TaxID=3384765 RepID=UPI003918AD46